MTQGSRDVVQWGRTSIQYDYHFSPRKTLAISVHPDLRVEVVAPLDTPIERIREKVIKRGPWIQRQKREFELLMPTSVPRSYVNGESHYYLGRRYRLRIETGDNNSMKFLRGRLFVTLTGKPTAERTQKMVEKWYRERAQMFFQQSLDSMRTGVRGVSFPEPRLQLRTMKTRWGSCSRAGLITLNPYLLRAPRECIEYVIAHELCHLKEPNHGKRFWHLLGRIMGDYQERRKNLQDFSRLIAG